MQPDPVYPQPDESQPESLPIAEGTPVEVTPVQEIVKVEPAPIQVKQPSRRNVSAIVLGIFAFILLVAVAGLGYWAFTLNTQLMSTQQQLTALQGEHDKLKTDYATLTGEKDKLNTDLTQTKADLEKANADLATAQADLKKSKDENAALAAKIDKSSKLANILYKWFTASGSANDIFDIDTQIKATNDTQLKALWTKFASSPSQDNIGELLIYLVTAIRNSLK